MSSDGMGLPSREDLLSGVRWVGVEGARIEKVEDLLAALAEIGQFQVMNADMLLGEEHLKFACYEALRAFRGGHRLASTPTMEILLKAACTTQIKVAISRLGVKPGSERIVLVAVDVDDEAMGEAVRLTGGRASGAVFEAGPARRKRIIEALGLTEPAEKSLLECIALSSVP